MGALLPSLTMAMTFVILMGPSICALQLGNAFPGHPFTQFSQEHPQVGEDRATTQRSYLGTSSYTDVTSLGKGSHRWWCGVYFLSFLAAEARTRDETSQSLSSPVCRSGPLAVPHPLGALDTTCEPEDTTQGQPQRKCSGNEAKGQIGCQVLQSP